MTKILVVDDEEDVELLLRQKFAKQIKSKELEFLFASNGIEAMKMLLQNQDINIILTDINMPEMDGLTLLSHLSELKRLYKAIIISAYGDMSNIRKAMNRGACDFITKPIDFNDLEITIFNAIDQYSSLKRAKEMENQLSALQKELMIAYKIQQSIIPHHFDLYPSVNNLEILGKMIPNREVSGDFFDFFPLNNQHLGFIIADVSGKSISGALFMAMTRAIIRTVSKHTDSPQKCLAEANRMLCADNDTCMFVTAFYGILDKKTGQVECANAGHNPPLLLRADKTLEEIARNEGIALGVSEETVYTSHTITLQKDDCLILYTDGITEAMNAQRELYSEKRFKESIKNWPGGPMPTLINRILEDVHSFTKDEPSADDITLLCIKQLV